MRRMLALVSVVVLAGCGNDLAPGEGVGSGVAGVVHLGPQCPVVTQNQPCDDKPAAGVTVTVSESLPGEAYVAGPAVASGTTGADGRFRIEVPPGEYVVTAEAGMFCELMDARVTEATFTPVDVPCDTGIR